MTLLVGTVAALSFVVNPAGTQLAAPAVASLSAAASPAALAAAPCAAVLRAREGPRMDAAADVQEICDVMPDVCESVEADADAIFAIIDENGDGAISRAELLKHLTKAGYTEQAVNMLFDKLDTDKSEAISIDELRAGFLQYTPLRSAPGLGAYNADYVEEIHTDADSLFAAIDTNGDGSISKDELRAHLKDFSKYSFKAISKLFKLLDVNKDGAIERTELRDAFVRYSALRQAIGEGPTFK
jgi:Ca2+-binding EF-hand superfamily protein